MKFIRILFILAILFSSKSSFASHIMGGEITWQCLANGQYKIYFSVYRDCSGQPIPPVGQLSIHNYPTVGNFINLSYSAVNGNTNGNDLSPTCYTGSPAFTCSNSDYRAVREYLMEAPPITLNGVPPPHGWIITYDDNARNSNDNLQNSNSKGITLRAKIFNYPQRPFGQCVDNSPTFREKPTSLVCTGKPFTYNHNATDVELDSLSFEWAQPLDNFNGIYDEGSDPAFLDFIQPGFSYTNPFPSPGNNHPNNVAATLDNETGEISLTSFDDGKFVSVIKVTAFKCGTPVAEIYRELQSVFTNTCQAGNTKPVITPPFPLIGTPTTFSDTFQAGDLINFNIGALDTGLIFNPNNMPQNVTIEVSGLQFGANYTDPNNGCPNPPCATLSPAPPVTSPIVSQLNFNWQTACNHVAYNDGCVSLSNTYTFVVRAYDDACPVPAQNIATIAITILADSVIESPNIQCVNVRPNGNVELDWDLPPDPHNSFTAWMVYASTNKNGPYTLIDSVKNYNTTAYTHTGANAQNQQLWYYVRSRSGCDGGVLNVPKDTIPTIFINSNQTSTCLNVSWNPLSSPNPQGSSNQYTVYREYPIGTGLNFYQNTTSTSLCDIFSNCTDQVRYRVELNNPSAGCVSSSNTYTVNVVNPDPVADFDFSFPCGTNPIQFTDQSTLSSGTITSWSWNFGDGNSSTQQNPTHSYSTLGSYPVTLTVMSAYGCTDDTTIVVSPTLPNADAGPDQTICTSGSIQIGSPAIPGHIYAWTSSPNNNSINNPSLAQPTVSPGVTTVYSLTVTDPNGCSNTDQVIVNVVSPFAEAGPAVSVCQGQTITIGGSPTGPSGSTYLWDNSTGTIANPTVANPMVTPLVTTKYKVTVTVGPNCIAEDSVVVTVFPQPSIFAGADRSICTGQNTILSDASGPNGTYLWTPGNLSAKTPTVSPSTTTNYTLTYTDVNGCIATDNVLVTVDPLPIVNAGADQSICLGSTVTLGGSPTGPAGSTYLWTNSIDASTSTQSNPTFSPAVTTIYTVSVTDGNGCSNTDQVTITVVPFPVADAGSDKNICVGGTTSIGGNPTASAGTVQWRAMGSSTVFSTASNPNVSPTSTTSFVVTVTAGPNCTDRDTVQVTVNPLPIVDAGADQSICEGAIINIGGSPTGPVGSTYLWTNNINSTTSTQANPTVSPNVTTIYTVSVTDVNGCMDTDQMTVTVTPIPVVDAGTDVDICIGGNTTLGGSPTASAGTIAWRVDGSATVFSTSPNPTVSPTSTTTYIVDVTDGPGCTASDTVTVTVNPLPIVDAGADRDICIGNSTTIGGSPTGPTGSTYLWTNNINSTSSTQANPTVSPSVTTIYTVQVTDANSCVATDQVTVTVNPLPTVDAGTDRDICEGSSTTLGGSPTGPAGSTYLWTNNINSTSSTQANPTVSPSVTTIYTVQVTDANSCVATDQVTVTVFQIPTADAGADQSICIGATATIGGSPTASAGNIEWRVMGSPTVFSTTSNPTVGPTATTSYVVTVVVGPNCIDRDTVVVTVNPLPIVDAGADQSICEGTIINIGGSPTGPVGSTYLWTNNINSITSTQANPTVSPNVTTIYTVSVTDVNGCMDTDQMTVTVTPIPVVDAGTDVDICIGGNTTLGGSPTASAGTIAWRVDGSATVFSTSPNPTVSPTSTTTYIVDVTDGPGCTASDTVTVTVNPLPIVDAGADRDICIGNSTTIGGSPTGPTGSTYLWTNNINSTSSTQANPTVSPSVTTIYTVQVTDANSCVATDQVTVTVNPLPTVDAGTDRDICEGSSTTLGGSPTGPAGSTYLWTNNINSTSSTQANPTVSPSVTTIYTVQVTDANSCVATDQVTVTVFQIPTADAGADQSICIGATATIGGSPTASAGNIEWRVMGSPTVFSTTSNPTVGPTATTSYVVTVVVGPNCIDRDTVVVTVNPLPIVDAGADQSICEGTIINIGGSPTGPVGSTYLWTNNINSTTSTQANPTVSPNVTTIYTVSVTDVNGCMDTDQMTVTVTPIPVVDAGTDVDICIGGNTTLGGSPTASAGTIAWRVDGSATVFSTSPNPTVSPTSTTTYIVDVTDGPGCTASDTVTVTVNPLPIVDAGADRDICIGNSTTIGGSPTGPTGSTYLWTNNINSTSSTQANPTVSPSVTTIYTVQVTDANSCVATDQVTVTVNPLPTVDAGTDRDICEGSSTTLGGSPTGPAGSTYLWTNNINSTSSTQANPTVSPSVTTIYTVQVTDANSCVATDQVTVTVFQIPTADAGADQSICIGATATIGGSPTASAGNIEWRVMGSPTVFSTTSNPTVGPTATTSYVVTVVVGPNCIDRDTVVVTVNPLPIVDAGADQSICEGTIINIGGSPTGPVGSTYLWTNNINSTTSTQANPTVSPNVTTIYTVSVTDVNGCMDTDQMTVTVTPIPVVDAGTDVDICIGGNTTLGGSPTASAGTIAWRVDGSATVFSTSPNPTVSPTSTTTYIVDVTDGPGCTASDTVTVTVNPLPIVDAGADRDICIGNSTTIGGSPTGPTGSTYLWTNNINSTSSTQANPTVSPSVTTIYTVQVTDANSCVATDQVTVTVNPLPTIDAGNDTAICINSTVTLGGNPTGPTTATFSWTNNINAITYNSANPIVTPILSTDYYLEVTDMNGCINRDTIVVTVNPLPVVSAGVDKEICANDTIVLGGNPTGPAGSIYLWSPSTSLDSDNISNPRAFPTTTTEYKVIVTDINGCVNEDSVEVTVNPLPFVDAGPDLIICEADSIQIGGTPTGLPGVSYSWSNPNTLNDPFSSNPKTAPIVTTEYVVTVTDANGCINKDTVQVIVHPLPDVDFKVEQTCFSDIAAFTDLSQLSTGSIIDWSWDFGDGVGSSTLQNPGYQYLSAGTYTVKLTVTTNQGCDTSISKQVTIHPLPVIDLGGDREICVGDTIELGGTPTGPQGALYSWFPAVGLDDPTSPNPQAFPLSTTKYYLTVTDINSCISTDSINIIVNDLPEVVATPDTSICVNTSVQLLATGANSYQWSPSLWLDDSTISNPVSEPLQNISYIVTGTDINGCINKDTVDIQVFNIEVNDTNLCYGDSVRVPVYIQGDTTGIQYQWSPTGSMNIDEPSNPWIMPIVNTRYYVTISNSDGCMDTDSLDVEVFPAPTADFDLKISPRCSFIAYELTNNSSLATSYEWYVNDEWASSEHSPRLDVNLKSANTIKLIVSNDNCTDTMEKFIPVPNLEDVLQIVKANIFTPNGDGVNDVFIIGFEGEFLHCANIKIFNRWGEKVYSSEVINSGWDGRLLNGEPAPSGTYFYVLDIDGEIIKGNVYLNR